MWKKVRSTNERRYAALVKPVQMLHQFRVDHVQGMAQTRANFNAVITKLQRETDYIRLAEGEDGWELVNEIKDLPELDDLELLAAAKKAGKRLWEKRKAASAKNKHPFRNRRGSSAASRNGGQGNRRDDYQKKDRQGLEPSGSGRGNLKRYNCGDLNHFSKNCPKSEQNKNSNKCLPRPAQIG